MDVVEIVARAWEEAAEEVKFDWKLHWDHAPRAAIAALFDWMEADADLEDLFVDLPAWLAAKRREALPTPPTHPE